MRRWWPSSRRRRPSYLVAARDAEGLSNPEIEELVRDRQLNQHVLARWRKYLRESKEAGEPVFRLWHAAAAIPEKEFATKWPAVRRTAKGASLVEAEVDAKPIASLRDLAGAYAAVLAEIRSRRTFRRSGGRSASCRRSRTRVACSMCRSRSLT